MILDERYEPEPDIVLLRFRPDYYASALPSPAAVLLLVEVADSSLAFDRDVKLPVYARNGVPEVWIVDVEGAVIERYAGTSGDTYVQIERIGRGGTIACAALPAAAFRVDDILGAIG